MALKILYIAGEGRSGSTLLCRVFDPVAGFFSPGETINIFKNKVWNSQICSCRQPIPTCDVWGTALRHAFGEEYQAAAQSLHELWRDTMRKRYLPRLLAPQRLAWLEKQAGDRLALLHKLYTSLAEVTDSHVIVDSSKLPPYSLLLSLMPDTEVYVLHLVRDVRAVVHSWRRPKPNPLKPDELVHQYPPLRVTLRWDFWNTVTPYFVPDGHYKRVHYEQFVQTPLAHVEAILAWLGEADAAHTFSQPDTFTLSRTHIPIGNSNRYEEVGDVVIAPREQWQAELKPVTRRMATMLGWPWLARYGYLKK